MTTYLSVRDLIDASTHINASCHPMTITPEYTRKSDIKKNSPINCYSVSCLINKGLHIAFNNLFQ